jgi:mRNA interferase RelE/StbE
VTYTIEWASSALGELRKLEQQPARRVLAAVSRLANDPRPAGTRPLTGHPIGTMRLRVGDYRVVYHMADREIIVTVVRVAHRRDVYRDR